MRSLVLLALLTIATAARAQLNVNVNEVEPNNTKATATVVNLAPYFTGINTQSTTLRGSASGSVNDPADYFHLNVSAAAPGLYRNQITILGDDPSNSSHVGTIMGLAQSGGIIDPNSVVDFQRTPGSAGATRSNVFYTFGAPTSLDYRVTGSPAISPGYYATYSQLPAQVADLGTFAGTITMSTGGFNDTALLILGGDYRPVPGYSNDDSAAGGGSTTLSYLNRTYAPGTYFVAASRGALATNLSAALDDLAQNGPVLEYGGLLATTSSSTSTFFNLTIADANRSVSFGANGSTVPSQVDFYRFTVAQPVPEPATLAALGLGALGLLRRRSRRAR